jgi:hypothetical protein
LKRLVEVNRDTIAAELRRIASTSASSQLSTTDFRTLGARVDLTTVRRFFGTWEAALKYAGLDHMFIGTQSNRWGIWHRNQRRSDEDILEIIRQVATRLGKSEITIAEIERHSEVRYGVLRKRFGSWSGVLEAANLGKTNLGKRYTDEQCFENLLTVWTHCGRPPRYKEMLLPPSKVGGKAYTLRFGTWYKALGAFVERVNTDNPVPFVPVLAVPPTTDTTVTVTAETVPQSTPDEDRHEIKLGLRFAILQRDRFRCIACGSSPATHPGCALHVDHIVPFSKGGKTFADNLRTLCATCNIGRGNPFGD